MVYLENTSESQVIYVPRHGIAAAGDLVFTAVNTIDLEAEIIENVLDLASSERYYSLALHLPEGLPCGEYEYTLTGGGTVLSTGLLVVGDTSAKPDEYEKDITYEQYTE